MQIGGAPIADDTALLAREIFGEVLYQGYGQTEAVPVCMMGPSEWFSEVPGSNPLRSAGRTLPFARLEIRDPESPEVELDIGDTGEIAILCDGQMSGFWNDAAATKSRMTADNFVLTGDIGRLDANGYLYVLDRKDDMIISGGFNIWPAELENALLNHPGIIEAAVYAIPDDRWGETPAASCVRAPGAEVSESDLIALCAENLGSYKNPQEFSFRRRHCLRALWARFSARYCGSHTGKVGHAEWREIDRGCRAFIRLLGSLSDTDRFEGAI